LPTFATAEAQAGALLPLDYLLSVMSDPGQPVEVRMRAAGLALPYCHAKPPPMSAKDAREAEARTAHLKTEWEELLA
jgi:hypothetical protein